MRCPELFTYPNPKAMKVKVVDNKWHVTYYSLSLVSTKKSQEYFEIIEIQFVMADFVAQRFEITFAVWIRLLWIRTNTFSPN